MSTSAFARLPLSGPVRLKSLLRPSSLLLCVAAFSVPAAAQGEQGRICEVKPAMRCLDKEKIEGVTLKFPIDAAAIQRDGFLICDSSFNYTTAPDIVLIMDNTGSMDSAQTVGGIPRWCDFPDMEISDPGCISGDPHSQRGPALQTFLDSALAKAGTGVNIGVVTFSQTAEAKSDKLQPLTQATKAAIKSSIVMEERGQTNYTAAFRAAMELLKSSRKPVKERFIIFVSDGRPNYPQRPDGDPYTYKTFWDSLPMVHSIFLGDNKDNYKDMQDVSAKTGGLFFNISDVSLLAKILTDDLAKTLFRRAVPTLTTVHNLSDSVTFRIEPSMHIASPDSDAYTLMMPGPLELVKGVNEIVIKTEYGYDGTTQDLHFKIERSATGPFFTGLGQICRDLPKLLVYNSRDEALNLLGLPFAIGDSAVRYSLTTAADLDSFDVKIRTRSFVTAQQDQESVPNTDANRKDSTWNGAETFQHQTAGKIQGDNLVQAEHGEYILVSYRHPFIREDSVLVQVRVKYGPEFDRAEYRDLNGDGRIETVTIRFQEALSALPGKLQFNITDEAGVSAERIAQGNEIAFPSNGLGNQDRGRLVVTLANPFPFGMTSVANPDSSGRAFKQLDIPMVDARFRVDDSVPPVIVKANVSTDKGDGHSVVKVVYSERITLEAPFVEPIVFKRDTVVFSMKDLPVKSIDKTNDREYVFHLLPGSTFKPVGGDSIAVNDNGETRDLNKIAPKSLVFTSMGGPVPSQAVSDLYVTFANGSKSKPAGAAEATDDVTFVPVDARGAAIPGNRDGHCGACNPMQGDVFSGSLIVVVTKQPVNYDFTIFTNLGQVVTRGSGRIDEADLGLLDKHENETKDPNQVEYVQRIVWTGRTDNGQTAGTGAYVLKAVFHYPKNFKTGAGESTGIKLTRFGFLRNCCNAYNDKWYY
ncbi:MAG: vWA domain-containing protein [Fibrobacteria bacterium]